MNFPLYIAKRYLRSKSSQNAVNIINYVTFFVIVIGAAALFIVLSAFSGLKTFSVSFSESFDPDLKAMAKTGKFITVTPLQQNELKAIEGVKYVSKELEEMALLTHEEKNHTAYIKGVDDKYNVVTGIDSSMYYGTWIDNTRGQAVSGIGISNILGVGPNDYMNPLKIIMPKPGKGSISQTSRPYNELPMTLSGVFSVNEDLDKNMCL